MSSLDPFEIRHSNLFPRVGPLSRQRVNKQVDTRRVRPDDRDQSRFFQCNAGSTNYSPLLRTPRVHIRLVPLLSRVICTNDTKNSDGAYVVRVSYNRPHYSIKERAIAFKFESFSIENTHSNFDEVCDIHRRRLKLLHSAALGPRFVTLRYRTIVF